MAFSDEERLRGLLGETIGPGGNAADTLFTDAQITDLLERHGTPEEALAEGWAVKAAELSTLVDTVEGSTQRRLSDAHDHAVVMAKLYGVAGDAGSAPATVIRKITRH